jgi:hypothetical protein
MEKLEILKYEPFKEDYFFRVTDLYDLFDHA